MDHALPEDAARLYRRILELDPEHRLARQRLERLAPSSIPPAAVDDLVLEAPRARREALPSSDFVMDLEPPSLEAAEPSPSGRPPLDPDVPLGALQPSSLAPNEGEIEGLVQILDVFLRARAQRSTGVLRFPGAAGLLIAHGVPAGLVGPDVLPGFLRLAADIGRVGEAKAETLARGPSMSPRAMARRLRRMGLLDVEEETMLPNRQLEDRMVRALQYRGSWRFEASTAGLRTDDLVPRVGELREWLVELLPRAQGEESLRAALALGGDAVRIVPGTEHFVPPMEAGLAHLLDGRRGLEEAARLAGVPIARALAWALVWLAEGLATRVPRPRSIPAASAPSRPAAARRPTLADLPPLRPRSGRPSRVRVERGARALEGAKASQRVAPLDVQALAELDDESRVHAMAEMVRTRDYFGILEVDAQASRKTIDDAHQRVRALIPRDVGHELESMVREVLRSVDEARDILMIPELRAAYEHRLEPQ